MKCSLSCGHGDQLGLAVQNLIWILTLAAHTHTYIHTSEIRTYAGHMYIVSRLLIHQLPRTYIHTYIHTAVK
jgi:hypothetical protein